MLDCNIKYLSHNLFQGIFFPQNRGDAQKENTEKKKERKEKKKKKIKKKKERK